MLKKIFAVLTLGAALVSCGKSNDENSVLPQPETTAGQTEAAVTTGEAATEEETTKAEEETSAVTETAAPATTAVPEKTAPEETEPEEETEESIPDTSDMSDDELLYIAQELYKTSCDMYWNFHVGCPYNIDPSQYTENQYGWQYYLVTDEGVNSLGDVERDYHTIFSDKYPNDLGELFIEADGRVYALNGSRGANIYYDRSEVREISGRDGNEIFFTVEVFYKGDDYTGTAPYSEEHEFSVVTDEAGNWFTGLFTLPY